MSTEIIVSLLITGHGMDPDALSEQLGVQPTEAWRKGDALPHTTMQRKEDGWCLSVGPFESIDIPECARILIEKVEPFRDRLKEILDAHRLDPPELSCVAYVEEENYPIVHFDKDLVEILASLGAEIDVDVIHVGSNPAANQEGSSG